jgi:hypothetical protein
MTKTGSGAEAGGGAGAGGATTTGSADDNCQRLKASDEASGYETSAAATSARGAINLKTYAGRAGWHAPLLRGAGVREGDGANVTNAYLIGRRGQSGQIEGEKSGNYCLGKFFHARKGKTPRRILQGVIHSAPGALVVRPFVS